jgi:hypothetical protein
MPFLAVHTSYPTGNICLKNPKQHEKLLNETYLAIHCFRGKIISYLLIKDIFSW